MTAPKPIPGTPSGRRRYEDEFRIPMTHEMHELIRIAAEKQGISMATFVRLTLEAQALQVLRGGRLVFVPTVYPPGPEDAP